MDGLEGERGLFDILIISRSHIVNTSGRERTLH